MVWGGTERSQIRTKEEELSETAELEQTIESRVSELDPAIELIAVEQPAAEALRIYVDHPAGVDLALAIVDSDLGVEVARSVARKLVLYQRRGGGQSQFSAMLELDPKSDRVQMALKFARENLAAELSVETLADAARLSPRQFSRVFREETGQTPAKAIERLRVESARLMIETSRHPIEVIAREAGFGDRERMRQAFLRAFGQPHKIIKRAAAVELSLL